MFPSGKAACSPPKSAGYPDSAHASPSLDTCGSTQTRALRVESGLGTRFCDESESDPISKLKPGWRANRLATTFYATNARYTTKTLYSKQQPSNKEQHHGGAGCRSSGRALMF
jgi:hypothetical protein